MSFIIRCFVILFALLLSMMVAGIALAIGIMVPDFVTLSTDPVEHFTFLAFAMFATGSVAAFTMMPMLALIAIAEVFDLRSILYYGFGGLAVAILAYFGARESISLQLENTTDMAPVAHGVKLIAAAGILGGFTYWLVAGRRAGRWKSPAGTP